MNGRPLTDARISQALRAHLPERAPAGLGARIVDAAEATRQQQALPSFLGALSDADPVSMFTKAVAAVVVIAVGLIGVALLQPGSSGPGGPGITASPTPVPTASPTPSPTPAPSPYVPPALTETFTSDIHGISISYPAGWMAQPATAPWTTPADPSFFDTTGDLLYDPFREAHLFVMLASQPLSGSFDEWVAAGLVGECTASQPVVVDRSAGVLATGCSLAYVPSGGRVYLIRLYASNDYADLRTFDADAWLMEILATVQLRPEDAIDIEPAPSP